MIRNLSAFIEVELKTKAQNASIPGKLTSLLNIATALYKSDSWWNQFDHERLNIGATKNSSQPDEVVISNALNVAQGSNHFWKNLLVVYTVRNHTVHDMENAGAFTHDQLESILASIAYVLLKA